MNQIGCCLAPEFYAQVDKLGYDYIEFPGAMIGTMADADFEKVVEMVKAGRIGCYGFVGLLPGDVAVVGPNFDPEKARAFAKTICKRGAALGIHVIGVGSPNSRKLPEGYDMALAWKQAEEFIRIFCDEAKAYPGISVMYEALNHTMCEFGLSMKEGADFVRRVDLPNLELICDTGHMDVENEGVTDIEYCLKDIKHVHLAEVVEGARTYLADTKYDHYKELMAPLLKGGYEGNFSVEPATGYDETGAKRTVDMLRKIVAECKA